MAQHSFFLSDLHIGNGAPENLYQKRYHEASLKAILRYMTSVSRNIRDVVILGDWFDMLAMPPAQRPFTVADAIAANPNIFEEQKDGSGDFITLFGSMRGNATFINGNHDQFVSVDDINAVLAPRCGRSLEGNSDPLANGVFHGEDLWAEHGHLHSLFFCPRAHHSVSDPPFGVFISRTLALICDQELAKEGKSCAPELKGSGEPVFGIESAAFALKEVFELLTGKENLAEALIDQLLFFADTTRKDVSYVLDDGSSIAAADIPSKYDDLWNGIGEDLKPLLVDITNSLKESAEELIAQGSRLVVMGHTHHPLLFVDHFPREGVYVNSGFQCPDLDDLDSGERYPTFVEIEHRWNRDIVSLKKVERSGRITVVNSVVSKHGR